jgi:hypothetical protein
MAWNVKGTYIETCSCEFFCPATSSRQRRRLEFEGKSGLYTSEFSWAA